METLYINLWIAFKNEDTLNLHGNTVYHAMKNPSQIHQEIQQGVIDRVHQNYSKMLQPFVAMLHRQQIRANYLTALAFMSALLGAFFLFRNHPLFIVFMLLHLVLDILDGSLARLEGGTRFGSWFDYLSDRTVSIVLLFVLLANTRTTEISSASLLFIPSTALILLALGMKILHHLLYIASKRRSPVVYSRSILVIALIFGADLVGVILVIVLSSLGLLSQLIAFFRKKKK